MKKIILLLGLFICLNVAACATNQPVIDDVSQPSTTRESEVQELDILYSADQQASSELVSNFKRDNRSVTVNAIEVSTVEELDRYISEMNDMEDLPDVILFPNSTSVDVYKMAVDQEFLDLSTYLAQDPEFEDQNYYPVLDAGIIDDRSCLIPLRFSCMYFLTSEEKMDEKNLSFSENYPVTELMEEMTSLSENCGIDESGIQVMFSGVSRGSTLYDYLRLSGLSILDPEAKSVGIEEDVFLDYASFAQTTYQQFEKSAQVLKLYSRDFVGAFSRVTSFLFKDSVSFNLRYYDSIFSESMDHNMHILPVPNYEDSETITADITLYAAVMQNTQQPQLAYDFVRYAMDSNIDTKAIDLPINRKAVQDILDILTYSDGFTIQLGPTSSVKIDKMSSELRQECESMLEQITSGSIRYAQMESIIADSMEAFLCGEADFDECYPTFIDQFENYIHTIYIVK